MSMNNSQSLYNPIFSEDECEQYANNALQPIKFIKVSWEQDNSIWLLQQAQLLGHEMHYTYPLVGQYLPYNIVFDKDGRELTHPRPLFSGIRTPRTTLT